MEYQESVSASRFVVGTRLNYFLSFTTFFFILVGTFHYVWTREANVFGAPKPWIMLAIAVFGFYMVGIALLLERRATQLYDAADKRAAKLEEMMGIQNGIRQTFIMPELKTKFLGIPVTHTVSIRIFYRAVALIWILLILISVYQMFVQP